MKRIAIIDACETDRLVAEAVMNGRYEVVCYATVSDALACLLERRPDAILLDLGKDTIEDVDDPVGVIANHANRAGVVCVSSSADTETVVGAMRRGAAGFLDKPYAERTLLSAIRAATARKAEDDAVREAGPYDGSRCVRPLLGASPVMREVYERIELYARCNASVLILGESGTGKELAAQAIHRASRRGNNRFQAVDCASVPEGLAESELFGTVKGAFTGAVARKGIFEAARGGSVFLDEVGELSQAVQAKLLRVLEMGSGTRMGSVDSLPYDVRILSATNAAVYEGSQRLRPELVNRLDTLVLRMPALREHKDDIPELAAHFLRDSGDGKALSPEAVGRLVEWDWPGNVRELRNIVMRATVLSGSRMTIRVDDIEFQAKHATGQRSLF